MTPDALLDTSVLLRHIVQDHPDHSPRATALIAAVERGEQAVRLADTVIFEAAFKLEKTYGVPRPVIRDGLRPILELPGVVLPGKRLYAAVFDLYLREPSLSFADCSRLCLAHQLELPAIISCDRKLNRLPGVDRIEP